MPALSDYISIHERFARSANLERDAGLAEPLGSYIVTARSLNVIESIAKTALKGPSGGAWTLIGPYGSGKSSLALLLDAALGPSSSTRELAWNLVSEASSSTIELIQQVHEYHQTSKRGFHRGLVTANREPVSHSILRALHIAVLRTYKKIPSTANFQAAKVLRKSLDDMKLSNSRSAVPSPNAILDIAKCLAKDAPLLLIIDEFGKNLEYISEGEDADPYLLQQLAEAGQGAGLPIFFLTLQHQSFENYMVGTDTTKAREWSKVQGRFETISYIESSQQIRSLISSVFKVNNEKIQKKINRWAQTQARTMLSMGLSELSDPKIIASCYPLHPISALVLPDICIRYGQYERSLFSFLTDSDFSSALYFLATKEFSSNKPLPSLNLDNIYDYFITESSSTTIFAEKSSRWIEIATRLRDIQGLSTQQIRLAKAVALLNLISTGGVLRASTQILSLVDEKAEDILVELEEAGVITYREFADEYRIWQGTDLDIQYFLKIARKQTRQISLIEILSKVNKPTPIVAAKHSAKYNMLRIFKKRYIDDMETVQPLDIFSPYDGELLLVINPDLHDPYIAHISNLTKPIVAIIPNDITELSKIAREVMAFITVLNEPNIKADWVAKREIEERLAMMQILLDQTIDHTFNSESCKWILLNSNGNKELPAGRGSSALSAAADLVYSSTPMIRNEMLNRVDLTSQGAKARRVLLSAMIEQGLEPGLGFSGYGPEVAIYQALLKQTGIHHFDTRDGKMVFCKPTDASLLPAWKVLETKFNQAKKQRINLKNIYADLIAPPIGMKAAIAPIFVTVGLLTFDDNIAVYEHGTFIPLLTSEISERIIKNPHHFDIKHFSNTTGARKQLISAFAENFTIKPKFRKQRVSNVLSIVSYLIAQIRNLDNYTLRTNNLSQDTLKVRNALISAVEPDELLFDKLPTSLGFPPVYADKKNYEHIDIFIEKLAIALKELKDCHYQLLLTLFNSLLGKSGESDYFALIGQAIAIKNEVLNPSIKAFVLTLANNEAEGKHDWIKAIATVTVGKAPAEWSNEDYERFESEISHMLPNFQRLVALHAEQRAHGGEPFDSLRITVTRSDGAEYIRLVGIDQNQRNYVEKTLETALKELTNHIELYHSAENMMLALLGERLIPEISNENNIIKISPFEEKNIHSNKGKINDG